MQATPKRSIIYYLVAINLGVFFASYLLKINVSPFFALHFPENQSFWPWQFLTHMFLHGGIAHILFNMYGLWAFGTPLLRLWGNTRFLLYFLSTGIGAGLFFTAANYYEFYSIYNEMTSLGVSHEAIQALLERGSTTAQMESAISNDRIKEFWSIFNNPVVGASGAIYAILVAFAMIYPNAKLVLIFLPYPIKAMYFVPILILGDMFFGMTRYSIGNVAHFAHIGGAVVGLVIMLIWRMRLIKRKNSTNE